MRKLHGKLEKPDSDIWKQFLMEQGYDFPNLTIQMGGIVVPVKNSNDNNYPLLLPVDYPCTDDPEPNTRCVRFGCADKGNNLRYSDCRRATKLEVTAWFTSRSLIGSQ